jgi:hypothetical protein
VLSKTQLIFLDPDNGLAGTNLKPYSTRSSKFAFIKEVTDWLKAGQSVVLYQHQQRRPLQEQVRSQLAQLGGGWALTFHRKSVRIYYVLPAVQKHEEILANRTDRFLETEWGNVGHFRLHRV